MGNVSSLTQEQIDTIVSMREAGKTYRAIGEVVGLSASAVSWQCLKRCVEPVEPTAWPSWETIRGPEVMARGNHLVRRFTDAEDRQLLALEASNLGYSEIARRLKRAPNSVRARLMTLARRDERRAAA